MRIGIDLGGTKIEGVVLDEKHQILHRLRIATPQSLMPENNYAETVQATVNLILQLQALLPQRATVGIGTPGSQSLQTGKMKNCNSTCLIGRDFQKDIQTLLGYDVRIANDADCFALSESIDGAAAEAKTVFGVIIGTGTGGGVVINQQLLSGPNRIAGEWGHNLMPGVGRDFADQYRPCFCGRTNCVETFLSGPGFSETYFQLSGLRCDAKQIVTKVGTQLDTANYAAKALSLYQQHLAYALSQIINVLDPDVIVLGGGLSNIQSLYSEVPKLWSSHVFSDSVTTALRQAMYGDSSGVRGAAWLW